MTLHTKPTRITLFARPVFSVDDLSFLSPLSLPISPYLPTSFALLRRNTGQGFQGVLLQDDGVLHAACPWWASGGRGLGLRALHERVAEVAHVRRHVRCELKVRIEDP